MKDLQIITQSFTPAKVDFNYEDIANRLDVILEKYKGLVFTEETVSDCKKTMTELRKGQKSLDDFRKETKKKLTLSVTEFENDCKTLYKKFDDVIEPLKEQANFYEVERREGKRIEVEGIIENIIEQYELSEKYSKELIVRDGYLIASITIKKVTEELEFKARELRDMQDEEELDREFIIDLVNQSNQNNELDLLVETYTRMMEHIDTRTIVKRINEDSKQLVEKREIERLRLEKLEEERLAKEKEIEDARIAKEEEDKRLEELAEIEVSKIEEDIEEVIFNPMEFKELPTKPQGITRKYIVTGNDEQLKDLEVFLNARLDSWNEIR